jgi:2-dehydropantoate 2-reductase
MGRKTAIVGAGAVGGYVGAHMVQAGEDVTFIDPWLATSPVEAGLPGLLPAA